jgi:hypothetical protein
VLLLGKIAPFELTVGRGIHFLAYLSLERDCIWVLASSGWGADVGAIGILRIKFVPEPSGWVVLVTGIGLLVVLYRVRGRA